MIVWTGSWFSWHQPWLAVGTSAIGMAVLVALVWWTQGFPADPGLLAVLLVGSACGRAVRWAVHRRRWRATQRAEGFTDEQVLAGERVLRRGAEPACDAERAAALHLAASHSRELGDPAVERWLVGLLAVGVGVLSVADTPRWLVVLALLAVMAVVSWVTRRRLDRRCDELLAQVPAGP